MVAGLEDNWKIISWSIYLALYLSARDFFVVYLCTYRDSCCRLRILGNTKEKKTGSASSCILLYLLCVLRGDNIG